jgi:hypothetical protein
MLDVKIIREQVEARAEGLAGEREARLPKLSRLEVSYSSWAAKTEELRALLPRCEVKG